MADETINGFQKLFPAGKANMPAGKGVGEASPFSARIIVLPVFLNGDFAMDFWLNWHDSGTILHQGNMMALGIEDDGRVTADIVGNTITSSGKLPKDEWIFFALSYHATTMTFDVLAQYGTQTVELFKNQPVTTQEVQNISYTDDNLLYLGGINADIHALSLYNIWRDVHEAATTKYQAKDGYVYGLVNYWPMDEGHGHIAADHCHTHDFIVPDSWKLENVNYALRIDDSEGAQADITRINTSRGDSYAIELWYSKGNSTDSTQPAEEVVFETATPTVVGDQLYGVGSKRAVQRDRGLDRQFLHSWRVAFEHPVTGEQIMCKDTLPSDLRDVLDGLAPVSMGRTDAGGDVCEYLLAHD